MDSGPGPAVPAITSASATCDRDAAVWSFAMATDAWTGGGELWWSIDGSYVEAHEVLVTTATGDGSGESLALTLDVVSDFRDVVAGVSTTFNCDTPGVMGVLRVLRRDGADVADCRVFGGTPDAWNALGLEATCTQALE